MLFNLQPDRSITGGSWYSDNEFESEFVEILNQQCYRILVQKAEAAKQKPVYNFFTFQHQIFIYSLKLLG